MISLNISNRICFTKCCLVRGGGGGGGGCRAGQKNTRLLGQTAQSLDVVA